MKRIEINNPSYPQLLKQIPFAPKELCYKGSWDNSLFENCLAVVGSRRMTSYGRQITERLVSEIASAGLTIVSGFMYGVDATAHKAALGVGGKTIAVMPCGIDVIHPAHQEKLYNDILENNGLIISEFEGNHPPALWTYPKRNKIVAGLSKAVMVTEAAFKSGSLITAGLALRYRRGLFAAPGPITSSLSEGTLGLIKDGAIMVTSAKEILDYYGIVSPLSSTDSRKFLNLSKLEEAIVTKLQQEPISIDDMSRLLGVGASGMGTTLSLMQLKGMLFEEDGKYHIKLG